MRSFLSGKKTYFVSFATILYAALYYGWDKNNWPQAVDFALGGSGLASLRAAIAKLGL